MSHGDRGFLRHSSRGLCPSACLRQYAGIFVHAR